MEYTKKSTQILRGKNVKNLAEMLLDNGMQVFTKVYESCPNPSYIYFIDSMVNIGYAQECESGCAVRFSTVHEPSRQVGTGYGLQMPHEGIINPTIEDAKRAFVLAPGWAASSDIVHIKKYKGFEDYISSPANRTGKTVFLTK